MGADPAIYRSLSFLWDNFVLHKHMYINCRSRKAGRVAKTASPTTVRRLAVLGFVEASRIVFGKGWWLSSLGAHVWLPWLRWRTRLRWRAWIVGLAIASLLCLLAPGHDDILTVAVAVVTWNPVMLDVVEKILAVDEDTGSGGVVSSFVRMSLEDSLLVQLEGQGVGEMKRLVIDV